MVEILMIGSFVNQIGSLAQDKGYRPGNYRLMALVLWCLGELTGLFCGLVLVPPSDPLSLFTIYLCALAGAGAGAIVAYSIARGLKPDPAQAVLERSISEAGFPENIEQPGSVRRPVSGYS